MYKREISEERAAAFAARQFYITCTPEEITEFLDGMGKIGFRHSTICSLFARNATKPKAFCRAPDDQMVIYGYDLRDVETISSLRGLAPMTFAEFVSPAPSMETNLPLSALEALWYGGGGEE